MNLYTKTKITYEFVKWRLTWNWRNTHYTFTVPGNARFMGPRDAVKLIKDGSVVGLTGLGANMRSSIMYWAIREMFEETGHPRGLTLLCPGGFGGRGRVPGTPEELGLEGLCTRFFTGHTETFKSILRLADRGKLELQCLPQGTFILLIAAMAEGAESLLTDTGRGTFMDPRTGRGTPVLNVGPQYVQAENGGLRYTCPKLDVAVFNTPAADRKGNLYVKHAAMIGESYEMAKAAKRNGGIVIANVGKIVEEGYDDVFLPAEDVDAIVYYPKTEQTGSKYHRRPLKFVTTESDLSLEEALERVRYVNRLVGVTPVRSPVDAAVARLAASVFGEHLRKGCLVNFGVGMPEEVSRLLYDSGLYKDMTGFTESGVFGGVAAPGIFFGAGINPTEIVSSAEAFRRMYRHLDATVLGFLQVDGGGNVNVSKRGEGAINYVGPGGFIDITTCARHVFFVGAWMANAKFALADGGIRVAQAGPVKFMERVDEVTFNGKEALKRGQKVFYITHVGAFRLTERGMELFRVMPGIDVQRDVIQATPMKIVLPESGPPPVVDAAVITGRGLKLSLPA